MGFEWDARKATSNYKKHGIPFAVATEIFLDDHRVERLDDREDYGEQRLVTIGIVDGVAMVVIYTVRKNIRIISAREADENEIEEYWNR